MKSEPTLREESLRTQIALGWITILAVLCWIFAIMICESAMSNTNFRDLLRDPGVQGISSLVFIGAFYGLMPLYVNLVSGLRPRIFRWIAVAAAGLCLIFWILHHLSHVHAFTRRTFTSNVLDLTLHALALWVLINSIKWANIPAVRE
jgi:hypothetical protein